MTNMKPAIPSTGLQNDPGQFIRCPIPPIGLGPTDNLRQFYNKGLVPQYRAQMLKSALPGSSSKGGSGSTIVNVGATATVVPSSGGSTASTINTASLLTPILNQNQNYSGTIILARAYMILIAAVSVPARIRLYVNKVSANNDMGRSASTPVSLGVATGLVADWLLQTSSEFIWMCSPSPVGYNADQPGSSTAYITVTNPAASSTAIQVSLTYASLST